MEGWMDGWMDEWMELLYDVCACLYYDFSV